MSMTANVGVPKAGVETIVLFLNVDLLLTALNVAHDHRTRSALAMKDGVVSIAMFVRRIQHVTDSLFQRLTGFVLPLPEMEMISLGI